MARALRVAAAETDPINEGTSRKEGVDGMHDGLITRIAVRATAEGGATAFARVR